MKQQLEDDNIVKDGQRIFVSMYAMDGKPPTRKPFTAGQHRPGSLALTDSDRQARVARQAARNHVLSNRWKKAGAKA